MKAVVRHKKAPLVTVLMPVYNGERHLAAALDSILAQTFVDFELLVIDDGSTDDSAAIVQHYADSRIRLERSKCNLGVVAALNRGLGLARGEFIARMDCDDISLPTRLTRQVEFLSHHPEVIACGTWMRTFGVSEEQIWKAPIDHEDIKARLLFESCLFHPTVMLRTEVLRQHQIQYDESFRHAEDFDLWTRLVKLGRLANLDEILLQYRLHSDNVGLLHQPAQLAAAKSVRARQLAELGLVSSIRSLEIHEVLSLWQVEPAPVFLGFARQWLETLLETNQRTLWIHNGSLSREAGLRFYHACLELSGMGLDVYRQFRAANFMGDAHYSWPAHLKLLSRCLLRFGR